MDFTRFSEILKKELITLPGEEAHAHLMPINRPFSSDAIKEKVNFRESAVAIYLFERDFDFHGILIQRTEYKGAHSGQISFPGGKWEEGDVNLEYTARREAFEEINIPFNHGHFIGKLTEVYIPVSNFLVQPHVFLLSELPDLQPEEREVQSILQFSLKELLSEASIKRGDIPLSSKIRRKDIPYFEIEGHKVWGATGMILSELREVLLRFQS